MADDESVTAHAITTTKALRLKKVCRQSLIGIGFLVEGKFGRLRRVCGCRFGVSKVSCLYNESAGSMVNRAESKFSFAVSLIMTCSTVFLRGSGHKCHGSAIHSQRICSMEGPIKSPCFYGCHLDRTLSKRSAPKGKWRDPRILLTRRECLAAATECRDLSTTHRKRPRCSGRDDICKQGEHYIRYDLCRLS